MNKITRLISFIFIGILSINMLGEVKQIDKVDVELFKVKILYYIKQNCSHDQDGGYIVPLCKTMKIFADQLALLGSQEERWLSDILVPLITALGNEIDEMKDVASGSPIEFRVTTNQGDAELLVMLETLTQDLQDPNKKDLSKIEKGLEEVLKKRSEQK